MPSVMVSGSDNAPNKSLTASNPFEFTFINASAGDDAAPGDSAVAATVAATVTPSAEAWMD